SVREQLIRLAVIRGIVRVQGEPHPFAQLETLPFQIASGAGAGQAQAIVVVQVLKIRVHAWISHGHCLDSSRSAEINNSLACSGAKPLKVAWTPSSVTTRNSGEFRYVDGSGIRPEFRFPLYSTDLSRPRWTPARLIKRTTFPGLASS